MTVTVRLLAAGENGTVSDNTRPPTSTLLACERVYEKNELSEEKIEVVVSRYLGVADLLLEEIQGEISGMQGG